jgi:hypothetical protein
MNQRPRAGISSSRQDFDPERNHGSTDHDGYSNPYRRDCGQDARVMRENSGPVYLHCHHGRHRGPSAAAVVWCIDENRPGEDPVGLLWLARTSEYYPGLWRDAKGFHPADVAGMNPELFETALAGTTAEFMAKINLSWDNLKRCRDAGWGTPANHPDLSPRNEALILYESFFELHHLGDPSRTQDFMDRLKNIADESRKLFDTLKSGDTA